MGANETLRKLVRESLEKGYSNLIEGIDVDKKEKTVSFNNSHEDTSSLINPTYININGIDVISIFKRKKSNDFSFDGNPLIYALKGLNGWKFKNSKLDITNLLKQFIRITEKIQPKYNTIISIPSQNLLNNLFLYRLNKIIKSDFQINDYLHKLTAEEVYEDFIDWNQLGVDYGEKYDKINKILSSYFANVN